MRHVVPTLIRCCVTSTLASLSSLFPAQSDMLWPKSRLQVYVSIVCGGSPPVCVILRPCVLRPVNSALSRSPPPTDAGPLAMQATGAECLGGCKQLCIQPGHPFPAGAGRYSAAPRGRGADVNQAEMKCAMARRGVNQVGGETRECPIYLNPGLRACVRACSNSPSPSLRWLLRCSATGHPDPQVEDRVAARAVLAVRRIQELAAFPDRGGDAGIE